MVESHRGFARFLYFKDLDDLCTAKIDDPENIPVDGVGLILFGLSSSPFLLSGAPIHEAHNYALFDPEFVLHMKFLRIDDLIPSADSLQEVEKLHLTCKEHLATANFKF